MKVELVGYYPFCPKKKLKYNGTCHIYLVDYGIDIRGILVKKKKVGYFVVMPMKKAYDPEEKKVVCYPALRFTDQKKQDEFLHAVQEILTQEKI